MSRPQFFLFPRMPVNGATPLACGVSTTHDSHPGTTTQASGVAPFTGIGLRQQNQG
ncbi:MAG TPA: hypothetical protein VN729_01085 [Ktedonobacteraceae bacterium]|nr:hypothetical protein [Ktedonobacteraceae bacterium]